MAGKSVLITGCSSGIGFDAATRLRKEGWRVLATCRQQADVERLISLGFESYSLDYSSSSSVIEGAEKALELTQGRLDALFNNGAFAIPGLVEDLPRDALRSIFETNVFGQFELISRVLPDMRQQATGCIVNCSSVLGFAALPFRGAYNASKFALEGLTDTLRLELRDTPLHVVLIEPGPIKTSIRQNSCAHFERWINVKQSAARQKYENQLIPRLYHKNDTPDRFELAPAAVSDVLVTALQSNRPKPRYYVTKPTHIAGLCKRLLSTRGFDWFLSKSSGI